MTYTILQFANDTTPALPDLDQNFNAAFLLTPVPCVIAGTNTLTLTQNGAGQAASVAILAYANGLQVCGVAALTNTGAVTAQLGSLAALNVYKDSPAGPVVLSGQEIVASNALTLRYDSALNSSAGGWHLIHSQTLTSLPAAAPVLAYTAIVPNTSQDKSFSVSGLLSTDGLAMSFPLPSTTGLILTPYFAAGDTVMGTVTVRCTNITAAATITPGTITVHFNAIRTT